MKAYKIDPTKRLVVGILLVMLTLGFCVVGTGAARAEQMGGPMDRQQGFGPDSQRDFGGHGGFGRDGGPQGMDNDVLKAIDALEDADTRAALETLMDNVHTAMEALHDADDDSREAAETGVKEARDALNEALTAAGIDAQMNEPPAMPEGGEDMARSARPENGGQTRPADGGRQNGPDFLSRENLENIDLEDEEQVQNLFQQFLTWIQSSKS